MFRRGTDIGLSVDASFLAAKGKHVESCGAREIQKTDLPSSLLRTADGGRAVAQCLINNPLPLPLEVEFSLRGEELLPQDRRLAARDARRCSRTSRSAARFPSRSCRTRGDTRIDARVRAIDPPSPQAALGWPPADTISFFPGVRQSLPWPDPFTAHDMRGIHFTQPLPGPRTELDAGRRLAIGVGNGPSPRLSPAGRRQVAARAPAAALGHRLPCRRPRRPRTAGTCGGRSTCPPPTRGGRIA